MIAAFKGAGAAGAMTAVRKAEALPDRLWINSDRTVWPSGGEPDQVEYIRATTVEKLRAALVGAQAAMDAMADPASHGLSDSEVCRLWNAAAEMAADTLAVDKGASHA